METRNFASTADYFERRAAKAATLPRRRELEAAARHYRAKADAIGQSETAGNADSRAPRPVPTRRQRLIELFRNYDVGNA